MIKIYFFTILSFGIKRNYYLREKNGMNLKNFFVLAFFSQMLFACNVEEDICTCWKEMVTRQTDQEISESCAYILEMKYSDIELEAGAQCADEIEKLTYDEEQFELQNEINEDAMMEGDEFND